MGGFVFMNPGEMGGYEAPSGGVRSNPTGTVSSLMEEGKYFATRDEAASKALETYVQACNTGLDAYTATAHDATNLYVGTDQAMAGDFDYLSDTEYSAQAFREARVDPNGWAEGVPDRLRVDAPGFERWREFQ